jgi:DNA-binding NarL/FixJ family response regulator
MSEPGRDRLDVLVLEDDPVLSSHLESIVAREFVPRVASSVAAAREIIAAFPRIDAAILDYQLPDGTGLDVIEHLHQSSIRIPILLLTAHFDRELAITAQDRGAEFAVKPASLERVETFLRAARAAALERERARTLDIAARIAERYGLSKQEARLLSLYASGIARTDLADAMKVSENTVKTMVRRILWKCGYVGDLRAVLDAWRDDKRNVG